MDLGPLSPSPVVPPPPVFSPWLQASLSAPPSPPSSGSPFHAAALAEHAAAVYLSPHEYRAAALSAGWGGAVVVEAGATQVAVANSPDAVVISARGSESCGDWFENTLAIRLGWAGVLPAGVRVHRGFQRQARRIREELMGVFELQLRGATDRRPVWICGHSLGGALAPLIACMISTDLHRMVSGVYTFNAPRVGGEPWRSYYEGLAGDVTHRVVVVRRGVEDFVSRIPLSRLGWRHVGQVHILRDGALTHGDGAWQALRAEQGEVKMLDQWRIISRLREGVAAHLSGGMAKELRRYASLVQRYDDPLLAHVTAPGRIS